MQELEHKVTVVYPNKLESLVCLKNAIGEIECFDHEDMAWVDQELDKLWKEYVSYHKEWKHKNQLYTGTLVEMEHMLATRERILNEVDVEQQLFTQQPTITQLFANKQAELVKEMTKLKAQLFESWNDRQ